MNLLAIDIGNTNIKLGLFQDKQLVSLHRIPTNRHEPQTLKSSLKTTLENPASFAQKPDAFVMSSVVPEAEKVVGETLRETYGEKTDILSIKPDQVRLNFDPNGYPLQQVGPDRVANLAAAQELSGNKAAIVVDFGTATTFNVISPDGKFLGGAITLGLETFWNVLSQRTAKLPKIEIEMPSKAIGQSTLECLQSGLGNGYIGLIRENLAQIKSELGGGEILTIATGGLSEKFTSLSKNLNLFDVVDPTFTLKGLRALFDHNRASLPAGK